MNKIKPTKKQINIEVIENKYLEKIHDHLVKHKDYFLKGLLSKNKILNNWKHFWNEENKKHKISDFNVGAERVIYNIFAKAHFLDIPNSAPVGSDIMYENDDAIIHIDVKTVGTDNIGDFLRNIFVGNNQISYKTTFLVKGKERSFDNAKLPTRYTSDGVKKICLTYFLTILHDSETFDILCSYITCVPNGELENQYKGRVFVAGKNPDKVRFNLKECLNFDLLQNKKRTLTIYTNEESKYFKKYRHFKEYTNKK